MRSETFRCALISAPPPCLRPAPLTVRPVARAHGGAAPPRRGVALRGLSLRTYLRSTPPAFGRLRPRCAPLQGRTGMGTGSEAGGPRGGLWSEVRPAVERNGSERAQIASVAEGDPPRAKVPSGVALMARPCSGRRGARRLGGGLRSETFRCGLISAPPPSFGRLRPRCAPLRGRTDGDRKRGGGSHEAAYGAKCGLRWSGTAASGRRSRA